MIPDYVPQQFRAPSDAARRCADTVTLAAIAGAIGMWVAVKLADGTSDQVIYETRADAIRHQHRPEHCTFVQIQPGGMRDHEAEALLGYWRKLADANVHDDDPQLLLPLMPLTRRDQRRQIRALARGSR